MGGGKSTYSRAADTGQAAAYQASEMARKLYEETQPLRSGFMGEFENIQRGQLPFAQNAYPSMLSAARGPIEDQYNIARGNVIANTPQGGRLNEALTDVETARAGTLGNVSAQYLMDFLNKAYGAGWNAPQTSISGLGPVMQFGTGAMQAAEQGAAARSNTIGSICCFIFIEGDRMTDNVRRMRDSLFQKGGIVEKGYRKMAKIIVPIMHRNPFAKRFIRFVMLDPICTIADYHYGYNSYGWMFKPIGYFWKTIWKVFGNLSRKEVIV